jgi:hypothetical protein
MAIPPDLPGRSSGENPGIDWPIIVLALMGLLVLFELMR